MGWPAVTGVNGTDCDGKGLGWNGVYGAGFEMKPCSALPENSALGCKSMKLLLATLTSCHSHLPAL